MAYKFQFGASTMSGNLLQEGTLTSEGAFVGETTISGAGQIAGGSLDILGAADIDGALTAATIVSDATVYASTNLSAAGEVAGGSLDILGAADVDGALTAGSVVSDAQVSAATSISAAAQLAGDNLNLGGGNATVSAAGALFAATSISGNSLALHGGLASISAGGVIDFASGDVRGALTAGTVASDATVVAATNVSAAGVIAGGSLDIAGAADFDGALTALSVASDSFVNAATNVSAAGQLIGGSLDIALAADIDGALTAGSVVSDAQVSAATSISAAAQLAGDNLNLGGGKSTISAAGAIKAVSFSGSSFVSGSDLVYNNAIKLGPDTVIDNNANITAGTANLYAISGSETLKIAGTVRLDGVSNADAPALAADSIYFLDATDSLMKAMTMSEYATAIAGPGLTATNGQLSSDAAAAPNGIADANANLSEGFNYGTATLSTDRTWTLPASPTAGDVVRVKAPLSLGGNTIIIATAGSHTIDNQDTMVLESDSGAVSFTYVASNTWKAF